MLEVLFQAMAGALQDLGVTPETLAKYQASWNDALDGRKKGFPCPACFAAGNQAAELKAMPAKGSLHNVKCTACNQQYSYIDEDF